MIPIVITFLAFALIHSITVAQWFKGLCARAFGDTFMRVWYRFLYSCVSGVTSAVAVFIIIRAPDRILWPAPLWLRWLLHGVQLFGFLIAARAFQYLDSWEFLGLRQVWRYFARGEVTGNLEGMTDRELVTTGVYGVVRHPVYVAGLIIFTFSPVFTVNGLTVSVLADLYFLFGMLIEERRFLRIFGEQYREYMEQVPRMFPRTTRRVKLILFLLLVMACIALVLAMLFVHRGDRGRTGGTLPAGLHGIIEQDHAILALEVDRLFPEWVRDREKIDPRFDPARMERETMDEIGPPADQRDTAVPETFGTDTGPAVSPDGRKYLLLTEGEEEGPDTELSVVDVPRKERRRLFFYGPATHIHGVRWIDNDVVVAVGIDDLSETTPGRADGPQPVVWIIHLGNGILLSYALPPGGQGKIP